MIPILFIIPKLSFILLLVCIIGSFLIFGSIFFLYRKKVSSVKKLKNDLIGYFVFIIVILCLLYVFGPFPMRTYGVSVAIGFLTAILISRRLCLKEKIKQDIVFDISVYILIGAMVPFFLIDLKEKNGSGYGIRPTVDLDYSIRVKSWNGLYSINNRFAYNINHRSMGHFNNQLLAFMAEFTPSEITQKEIDQFEFVTNYLNHKRDLREFPEAEKNFYQVLARSAVDFAISKYGEWVQLIDHASKIKIKNLNKEVVKYANRFNFLRQKDLLVNLINQDSTIEETNSLMAIVNGLTRLANQSTITAQKRLDLQQAAGQIVYSAQRINV